MIEASLNERLYRSMLRIRRVEEKIIETYWDDKIKSPVHLSIGQEATASGVCEALASGDTAFGTYRGHHVYLAKGGDMKAMIAELYGKATGCARGKGGSMHLVDWNHGVAGTSAVVGTTIANAVGHAYAHKIKDERQVVAVFFGDGAVNEGVFHESLNFAGLKRLPIMFICENNSYAVHSHYMTRRPLDNVCEQAASYGLSAHRVEGNDVLRIHEWSLEAAREIRSGDSGPRFVELETYRWMEHVGPGEDFDLGYRIQEERQPWVDSDQIPRVGAMLPGDVREGIEEEVGREVDEAFDYAERSPFPDLAELHMHVFDE